MICIADKPLGPLLTKLCPHVCACGDPAFDLVGFRVVSGSNMSCYRLVSHLLPLLSRIKHLLWPLHSLAALDFGTCLRGLDCWCEKCILSTPKRHVGAVLVVMLASYHSSMLQISWGSSLHCLLYIRSLRLYMMNPSSLPHACPCLLWLQYIQDAACPSTFPMVLHKYSHSSSNLSRLRRLCCCSTCTFLGWIV